MHLAHARLGGAHACESKLLLLINRVLLTLNLCSQQRKSLLLFDQLPRECTSFPVTELVFTISWHLFESHSLFLIGAGQGNGSRR
ncbi:hypothetical protein D9M71_698450 [compost metagenome]